MRREVWALVPAALTPVALIGGWQLAAGRQGPAYDATRDTISALAARGAPDRWLMTTALALVGVGHVLNGVGLVSARRGGRAALAVGGVATGCVAAFPQPAHGSSAAHTAAATVSFVALAVWIALGARRTTPIRALRPPPAYAVAVGLLVLLVLFDRTNGGGYGGLTERLLAGAEALVPLAVALGAWWASRGPQSGRSKVIITVRDSGSAK